MENIYAAVKSLYEEKGAGMSAPDRLAVRWTRVDEAVMPAGVNAITPISVSYPETSAHWEFSERVEYTRADLIPNAAYVAGLEAALRPETSHGERKDHSRIGHRLAEGSWHVHLAGFCCEGDAQRFLAVALSARPDAPGTRVVTVDQLRKWASTVKTYTQDYTIDELGDDLFTLGEIRAIIGEVK